MNIGIKYDVIIERCKLLSRYEAQAAQNADGSTQYMSVKMTDKEDRFIIEQIKIAARQVESVLNTVLDVIINTRTASETDGNGGDAQPRMAENGGAGNGKGEIVVTFDETQVVGRLTGSDSFIKSICETIVAWVLSQWFMDRYKVRAEGFLSMYNEMLTATKTIGVNRFAMKTPRKRHHHPIINETSITIEEV